MRILIIISIF